MKRTTAVVLSFIIAAGSTSAAFGANFTDINNVPWEGAKTYINAVADAGLMVGDEDIKTGKKVFRANDKVTYNETAQLAYSLLKKSGNLKDTTDIVKKWSSVLNGYNIPSWAHESVAYCLQYNILSLSDVSKFMKDKNTSSNATREGVAVIFGKALSSMQTVNTSATLSFKDSSAVAQTSVPYVDLLVRMGIMVGDDDNNFNPKNYINRAEMAVVVSNTNTKLGSGSSNQTPNINPNPIAATTVRGPVTGRDSNMITVLANNQSIGFVGNDQTPVFLLDNSTYRFSDIKAGDIVSVTYQGTVISKIVVESVNPASNTASVEGYVDEIDGQRVYINKSTGGTEGYSYANNIEVTLDGSKSTLKEVVDENDKHRLKVKAYLTGASTISKLEATTTDGTGIKGTLKSITKSDVTIKKSGGTSKTYEYISDFDEVVFKLDGKTSTVNSIKSAVEDDTVAVTIYTNSNDRVTKVVASTDEDDADDYDEKGVLKELDSKEAKVKTSSGTEYFELASDVTYRYDGDRSTNREIRNLIEDEDDVYVKLILDSKDRITEMYASLDEDDETLKGDLTNLTSSEVTIRPSGKSKKTYTLADDVTYRLDGSSSKRSEIQDAISDGDVTATLTLNAKDKVTKIVATTDDDDDDSAKGEIRGISKSSITIKPSGKPSAEYDWADDVTYRLDGKRVEYADIRDAYEEEDEVTAELTLNSRGDVTRIDAETDSSSSKSSGSRSGEIISISSSYIKIRTSSGTTKEYDFASSIDYKLDGSTVSYSKLSRAVSDGDVTAELTLNSRNLVTRVDADSENNVSYDKTVRGTIRGYYEDYINIRNSKNDEAESYDFANKVVYRLDGKSSTYKEIKNAYSRDSKLSITLYLNSSKKVVKIEASTTGVSDDVDETISGRASYIANGNINIIERGLYYISSSCVVRLDGASSSISEITGIMNHGNKLDVDLDLDRNDNVLRIEAYTLD